LSSETHLIGVAGTVTTLAAMELNLPSFDEEKIHGYRLSTVRIDYLFERLKILSVEQLRAIPQILPMRADIILAGVMILQSVMHKNKLSECMVSVRGLRFGLLYAEAEYRK